MNRIVLFASAGNFVHEFGGAGTDGGQFQRTGGVALSGDGAVYVTDWEGNRIQKLQLTDTLPIGRKMTATPAP